MPSMHQSWAREQRATSQPQTGQEQKKGGEGTLSQLLCSLHAWWHVIISFLHLLTGVCRSPALGHQLHESTHTVSLDIPAALLMAQCPESSTAHDKHLLKTQGDA